jgi:phage baseplate assembly protein V
MSAELSDLQNRLANLLRVGTVHSIVDGKARVAFGENNVTAPLPWMVGQAGDVKEWNGHPKIGEQVLVMNPGGTGNAGAIMRGAIFTDANPANGSGANDRILNLPDNGNWQIYVGNAHIKAKNGEVKITVDGVHMTMTHSGIAIHGDVTVQGKITSTDLITGGSVVLQTHVHGGVQSGGSNTSAPVA